MRTILINAYLDFRNNYLTIEKYAEHNGLSKNDAERLIILGQDIMNSSHPES